MEQNQSQQQGKQKILDDFLSENHKKSFFNFSKLQDKLHFNVFRNRKLPDRFNGLFFSLLLYLITIIFSIIPIPFLVFIPLALFFGLPAIIFTLLQYSADFFIMSIIGFFYPMLYFSIFKVSRISIILFFLLNTIGAVLLGGIMYFAFL